MVIADVIYAASQSAYPVLRCNLVSYFIVLYALFRLHIPEPYQSVFCSSPVEMGILLELPRYPAFIDLLLEMKKVKDKAVEKGKDSLSYYHYHKFDKKYDELIEQAGKENPLPETTEKKRGRKKKGKILALVERLAKYKASVGLFIHNFSVPFDNNQAERDLRMIKVKTKVFGCFRTEEGARDYLKIMSYVGTAHKQGYNAYEAIKKAISCFSIIKIFLEQPTRLPQFSPFQ